MKRLHYQLIKGLANVILNNGSKATDQLVPKGLATGPDGKDYQDTFKNGLKYDPKRCSSLGRAKKLGKDQVTIELAMMMELRKNC